LSNGTVQPILIAAGGGGSSDQVSPPKIKHIVKGLSQQHLQYYESQFSSFVVIKFHVQKISSSRWHEIRSEAHFFVTYFCKKTFFICKRKHLKKQ